MEEAFAGLVPDLLARVDPEDLRRAYLRAQAQQPPEPTVDISHLPPVTLTVGEVAASLVGELAGVASTTFRHLTRAATSRLEVVVAFLALLELYKDGLVELDQAETFGELRVSWLGDDDQVARVGQGLVGEEV
jgi:segregation and condensation protein A